LRVLFEAVECLGACGMAGRVYQRSFKGFV